MTIMFSWNKLISRERAHKQGRLSREDEYRTAFESDFDRIIYSEPFRRLGKKTQVHPLAPNDHVHNRMTHSLEVSSVGRSMGRRLIELLQGENINGEFMEDIPCVLQVACLAHDIGNPPFGHAGEYAIRKWFSENQLVAFPEKFTGISEDLKTDLMLFEGNAQGFRVASRSDNPKCGYMRLTFASLGAMVKYPWDSRSDHSAKGKYNYFTTESDIFSGAFDEMGLRLNDKSFARHPLSFLTEAADDICYRMLDMEDAVSMKIFNERPVKELFFDIAEKVYEESIPITEIRGRAIKKLIQDSWQVFEDNYDLIMVGGYREDLKSGFSKEKSEMMREIKNLYEDIFSHRAKVAYELGAYKILGRILNCMCESVQDLCVNKSYKGVNFISSRCLDLTWGRKYVTQNESREYSWWLSQISDYVAGLTDNYAMQLSSEMEGL